MAKKNDFMRGRNEGMAFALQIAEKKGIDGLREECRFRGATSVPSQIPKEVYDEYEQRVKSCTIDTVMSMSLIALVDSFGFGKKRLERFRDEFEHYCQQLVGEYVSWPDIVEALKEEKGVDISIRWNEKQKK